MTKKFQKFSHFISDEIVHSRRWRRLQNKKQPGEDMTLNFHLTSLSIPSVTQGLAHTLR